MDKLTKIGLNSNVPEELSDHEIVEDDLAVYDNKKETSETNENKAPLIAKRTAMSKYNGRTN